MQRFLLPLLLCFLSTGTFAQEIQYHSSLISPELQEHANAVVREENIKITIESVDKMRIMTRKVVTILNKHGDRYGFAGDHYSDNVKIKNQFAALYDASGNEIKKVKQKHFSDRSAIDSGTLYSDTRISYFEYTPQGYPYTLVYESEIEKENTIFVNDWRPVRGYHVSVQNSTYILENPAGIGVRFKEENLEDLHVEKNNSDFALEYQLKDFPAYNYESLSPSIEKFAPGLQVALNRFSLVGVEGEGASWKDFGKWQYDNLLAGRNLLPESTIRKVRELTAGVNTNVEKARIIYEYVQENSRYISVQLGIGGWEPMAAAEVDKLKYGDCKGLTNYTKALLDSQKIPSYYAVVYAGEEKKDIDADFTSMQGNHVILNLPQEEGEDVWLECTSQTHPFNYLGDFTDDRNVLLVKPEGGEIVKTRNYTAQENLRESNILVNLDENGTFSAKVLRKSRGIPYGDIYPITTVPEKNQMLYYQKSWGHLKNLNIDEMKFVNDREKQEFTEELVLTGKRFSSKAGDRLLLPLHFLSPRYYTLPRRESRKLPLEISRGRTDKDTFRFVLPQGFETESIPKSGKTESEFGSFEVLFSLEESDEQTIIEVARTYILNEGVWPAESHDDFRSFMSSIQALGNQKAVIIQSR